MNTGNGPDPKCTEIAEDRGLWEEHIDPGATMNEAQFDAMPVPSRIELIHETFPQDCNCEE